MAKLAIFLPGEALCGEGRLRCSNGQANGKSSFCREMRDRSHLRNTGTFAVGIR
jgi:hypothetical protein